MSLYVLMWFLTCLLVHKRTPRSSSYYFFIDIENHDILLCLELHGLPSIINLHLFIILKNGHTFK